MSRTTLRGAGCSMALFAMTWMLCLLTGCSATLPIYPAMSDADALGVIAARLHAVRSISAPADLTLTNATGQTVSLDGALVARPPERARLRAWKFGSPVLDLTIVPDGVWAYAASRDGSPSTDMTKLPAQGVSRSIEMLSGAYFDRARAMPQESTDVTLVVVGEAFGRDDVRCAIDRATLTPRRFWFSGDGQNLEILLDEYELIGEIVWARRMEFRGPDGKIQIRLGETELSGELPENAFVPPARATRLP